MKLFPVLFGILLLLAAGGIGYVVSSDVKIERAPVSQEVPSERFGTQAGQP